MLSNARVVLVRPHYPGNVGSVARAMSNFGLRQLTLVEPHADVNTLEARRLATHGLHILDAAVTVGTLDDAVADCRVVIGTSGHVEGVFRTHGYGRPEEMLPGLVAALPDGPCALVFGPEPSGLSNVEVARCHGLIRIPTDSANSSLNLSHAVTVCLYELRRAWLAAQGVGTHPTQRIAPFADQERMFARLREALEAVHFVWGTKGDALFHAVRHLIARARPSPNEVRILYGLARQLRWVAKHGVSNPPPDPEGPDG